MAHITRLYEIQGTYGSNYTRCTVFCAEMSNGATWYVCEGSVNVNCTFDELIECQDVETLDDVDCFTWQDGINSLNDLETAVEAE